VKLFPAAALGPGYVRSLLAPLHDVPLLATGGITAANALEFLDAGAVAVGVDASRAVEVWERVRVES
jgi:2-dehydro-3-deoxyphosphogluconate aldolase/(4S)-4-hydroxy-2-oxoglutarate aldolase